MRHPLLVKIGGFFFAYRNGLAPVIFLGVALVSRPRILADDPALDHVLDAAGILLACFGQTLRALANGFAYIKRGGRGLKVYATDLTMNGVYAHCRNPIYVGDICIAAGLFMIHNGALAYMVGLPLVLFGIVGIIAAEEAFLRKKFGADYDDFCGTVPRYGFRLAGLGDTLRNGRMDWSRAIRKDYGTTFGWISGVIWLLIWQNVVAYGFDIRRPTVVVLLYCWALAIVGWLAVRLFKTDRRARARITDLEKAAAAHGLLTPSSS